MQKECRIGTAGWRLPKSLQPDFPGEGTHLARYARRLNASEINASFYKHHRLELYAKWAGEAGEGFRFAVKVPRWVTHHARLRGFEGIPEFLDEIAGLGDSLGPILLQLPPSLRFEPKNVDKFLTRLRKAHDGLIACEPRHESWFAPEPEQLLKDHRIARVAAHPPITEGADQPGGWQGLHYYRLHGSPKRFYSAYDERFLKDLAKRVDPATDAWVIFNNTAESGGLENAVQFHQELDPT